MDQDTRCAHAHTPPGAKFCPECGASLATPAARPRHRIEIRQEIGTAQGEVAGLKVERIEGGVTVTHGHVIEIHNPSPEALERLMAARQVTTEVRVGDDRASPGISPEQASQLGAELEAIQQAIHRLEKQGQRIDEVDVGKLRFGRVELLLKQAVLLRAEADQMFLEQIRAQPSRIDDMWSRATDGRATMDLADFLQDFDAEAHENTLRKARSLLQEARELEPHNAEVLLHLAEVMDQLEEDSGEIDKLLYSVIHLLDPPRNDSDKFHLAQATYLSAILGDRTPHPDMLNKARNLFAQLGRTDWVEQCDLLAGQRATAQPAAAQATQAPLNPTGQWRIQISAGGFMDAALLPNGALQGQQHHPMLQGPLPFSGMWGFDPGQSLLSLQGTVAGMNPFFLSMYLQGQPDGSLFGAGTDGHQYRFMRLG
jgi:hypothetical protein